jgi:hypothetical protein
MNLSSVESLCPQLTAQGQEQLSSLSTVHTPFIAGRRQSQKGPTFIASNFHAKSSSPLTPVDLNISQYTVLNTIQFDVRTI